MANEFSNWMGSFKKYENGLFQERIDEAKSVYQDIKRKSYELHKMERLISKKSQNDIYEILKIAGKEAKNFFQNIEKYRGKNDEYYKVSYQLGYVQSQLRDPLKASKIGSDFYERLKKRKEEVGKERATAYYKFTFAKRDLIKSDEAINEVLGLYKEKKEKEGTRAEKVVIALIIGAFATTLLYSLSQVNPENVTLGAFTTATTPAIWVVFTAVVIFLGFFFVNHKLK